MADLIMKQARAIVDDRTTVICLDVHGSIMPVDQAFETLAGDFMSPPFHVHCRTLVGPYMKGFVQEARKAANAELMKRPKSERRKGPDGPAGSIPGPVTGNPPSGFSRRDDTDLSDAELFNAKLPEVKAAPVKIKRDPGRYEPKVQYGKATDEWGEDRASEIALTAQRVNIMLHGLTPEAKQVPIVHQSMKRAMELGSFDPVKKQILLDYTAPGAISTLVHEMGHMTDHMILNEGRQGSAIDAVLRYDDDHPLEAEIRAWWDAIEMSVSGDQILQAFYSRDGDETASYLAEHQEFFARSYAQWGLDKMGDSAGKAELMKSVNHDLGFEGYEQWGEEEFKPIAAALDALFLKKDHPELFPNEDGAEDDAPALTGPARLKAQFDAGYTGTDDHIWQGNRAEVEIGTLADGTKVVRKTVTSEEEADKEYLSSLIANALGVEVFTAKVGPQELVMDYVEGQTGNGWLNDHSRDVEFDWSIKSDQKRRDAQSDAVHMLMTTMDGGREIGLLDWLIHNPDRHAGNWLIRDGRVYPIDHGNSLFADSSYEDDKGKTQTQFNGSPFALHWLGAKVSKFMELKSLNPSPHWTREELGGIREKLAGLEAEFSAHPGWFAYVMKQLDDLIAKVKA